VEINAAFVGIGKAESGKNMSMSRWGNSYSRSRWSGQWREATLDLSVTVDGNSVDLQDAVGSLGKSKSGSISVYE
jgi:ribosome modulation factor